MAAIQRAFMAGRGNTKNSTGAVNAKTFLIINAGSSSVKFQCYAKGKILVDGVVEEIGKKSTIRYNSANSSVYRRQQIRTYTEAGLFILSIIPPPDIVVHRVVHGGTYTEPAIITPSVLKKLKSLVSFAPLHMPQSITLVSLLQQKTNATHIACFDTMFHQTMPLVARRYAIPFPNITKHGFHGLAHEAMMLEALRYEKKTAKGTRIITCQLGNGASICAIRDGKSIDTSMGFTPLEGLMMGTRSGDLDPAIIPYLCSKLKKSPAAIQEILEKKSGLYGIAKESDVRMLLHRNDKNAQLALNMFTYRLQKYIGAYIAALEGIDLLILSGGVSRSTVMRCKILFGLEQFGIIINQKKIKKKTPTQVSIGKTRIWIIDVDEQEHMMNLAKKVLKR